MDNTMFAKVQAEKVHDLRSTGELIANFLPRERELYRPMSRDSATFLKSRAILGLLYKHDPFPSPNKTPLASPLFLLAHSGEGRGRL
jgi:hypothetical protein